MRLVEQEPISTANAGVVPGDGVRYRHPGHHQSTSSSSSPTKRNQHNNSNNNTCGIGPSSSSSSFSKMLHMPQLWSLSSLIILTFVVATACTFLINTAAFLCLSPLVASSSDFPVKRTQQSAAAALRRGGGTRGGGGDNITYRKYYAPRVVLSLDEEEEEKKRTSSFWWFVTSIYYFYVRRWWGHSNNNRVIELDYPPPPSNIAPQGMYQHGYDEGCIPKADWQSASFPNCNSIHELSLSSTAEVNDDEEQLSVLGEGWFRTTWMLRTPYSNNETTVLKTLRIERDFTTEFYELHRRDAVAMERLTSSKFVVDVYGFCGQSTINEMADFQYADVRDLERFDRRLRGLFDRRVVMLKLQIAASIAQGVVDLHSIDGPEIGATMVHYDLNPRNIAMFKHGRPKINDFNIAEFLKINPKTNKTCGFPNRMHQPWWRAPEEVSITQQPEKVDEKVDIYALGSILFHILTTHAPRGKMKEERMEEVRGLVEKGIAPTLPEPFASDTGIATTAFKKAMERCFVVDPSQRASAQEVLEILLDALEIMIADDKKT